MKALILDCVVVDIAKEEFPVSPKMKWMDCPDECQHGWKLCDGELVAHTPDEIKEQKKQERKSLDDYIGDLRDERALNFPYKNIIMRLTDGARTDLNAAYSSVMLNSQIADDEFMMLWQEKDHDAIRITAGDLRRDGLSFMEHRQKCFTTAGELKKTHRKKPFGSKRAIEKAFDRIYKQL